MKPDGPYPSTLEAASPRDRRQFLRACVRYPVLAGLVVAGVVLRTRKDRPEGPAFCLKRRVCDGCNAFATCELPQAKAVREKHL